MAIVVELQGADRVCQALNRFRLTMRVIVHRVNAPLTTRTMMVHVENSIHNRVAQTKVRRAHVDLRAQRSRTIWKLSLFHALEKIEILFDRTIAVRAVFAGLGQRATILAHLIGGKIADESLPISD